MMTPRKHPDHIIDQAPAWMAHQMRTENEVIENMKAFNQFSLLVFASIGIGAGLLFADVHNAKYSAALYGLAFVSHLIASHYYRNAKKLLDLLKAQDPHE